MQAQRTGANGAPVATATLTRRHRDALCCEARRIIRSSGDLSIQAQSVGDRQGDRKWLTYHREWVLQYSRELQAATRLLDQLGWLSASMRDEYILELDEETKWLLFRLERAATGGPPSSADEWWAAQRQSSHQHADLLAVAGQMEGQR